MNNVLRRSRVMLLSGAVAVVPMTIAALPPVPQQFQFQEPVPEQVVDPLVSPLTYTGGTVVVRVTVAPTGQVTDVEVVRPFPALTEPVAAAVREWRFKPATVGGRPVEARTTVAVHVSLVRTVVP
jgi:protein TonB